MEAIEYEAPVQEIDQEEVEEESWQYSRVALPWLLLCFLFLVALFCLTFWQQTGNVKRFVDGVPRVIQLQSVRDDDREAGLPKSLRNLRIADSTVALIGLFLVVGVFFWRPKPGLRKAVNMLCALILILAAGLAWIAFGVAMNNYSDARQCPENYRFTLGRTDLCPNRRAWSLGATALDAAVGFFALLAAALLAYNTAKGHWKMAPRGWQEEAEDAQLEQPKARSEGEVPMKNVGWVRKMQTALALFALFVFVVGQLSFTIILHEDREVELVRNARGRHHDETVPDKSATALPFEFSGWPVRNTRLRYSYCALGIVTVLFNFLPFRSKTVAFVFGFLYLATAVTAFVAFGFDVRELRQLRDVECPKMFDTSLNANLNTSCIKHSFYGTATVEFIFAVLMFAYVVVEYVMPRRAAQAQ